MKALKLKSSSKEDPVWGETFKDCGFYYPIFETANPMLFDDSFIMGIITSNCFESDLQGFDQWELVTVKIVIQ